MKLLKEDEWDMIKVDIQGMQELITQVSKQLLENYNYRQVPNNREEMFKRFTEANLWAVDKIRYVLKKRYPNVGWSSDLESDFDTHNLPKYEGAYWILDPIDGGVHLHQGFSFWSMSLCLIEDGQLVFSMIYDPYRKEFFHAVRDEGAFLNGKPIKVSHKSKLHDAILATAPPGLTDQDIFNTRLAVQSLDKLIPEAFAIRMLGSVALQLAYVACGRIDAYWEHGDEFYDWAAGALLVREAKGRVIDMHGDTFTWGSSGLIAGNEEVLSQIQTILGHS
ncbi:inositol monophosphatase family protein [Bacillus cereus]|uniref:inositol monophosphatase family protein n=3 Tax=Bacillus TaxID=1386 RepID=UPI001F45B6CC|nr:inositol monophosphatase [Bacillus cereus]